MLSWALLGLPAIKNRFFRFFPVFSQSFLNLQLTNGSTSGNEEMKCTERPSVGIPTSEQEFELPLSKVKPFQCCSISETSPLLLQLAHDPPLQAPRAPRTQFQLFTTIDRHSLYIALIWSTDEQENLFCPNFNEL